MKRLGTRLAEFYPPSFLVPFFIYTCVAMLVDFFTDIDLPWWITWPVFYTIVPLIFVRKFNTFCDRLVQRNLERQFEHSDDVASTERN